MEPGRAGLAWAAALLLAALGAQAAAGDFDPYRVLGVGRGSGQADIKKAYKRLAREWVSIPRSTLMPAYKHKAHRRKSFEPEDSLALPSNLMSRVSGGTRTDQLLSLTRLAHFRLSSASQQREQTKPGR